MGAIYIVFKTATVFTLYLKTLTFCIRMQMISITHKTVTHYGNSYGCSVVGAQQKEKGRSLLKEREKELRKMEERDAV